MPYFSEKKRKDASKSIKCLFFIDFPNLYVKNEAVDLKNKIDFDVIVVYFM